MEENNNLTQLRVDVGEIKGILSTVVSAHAQRIEKNEKDTTQLRTDLTAVKNEGDTKLSALALLVEANKNRIGEVASDTAEVKEKQNGAFGKTMMVVSPIVAVLALIWNVLGGKT